MDEFQKLNFLNTLELLRCAIKNDILQQDPKDDKRILIYREAGTEYPEGLYSENIHDVAREMFYDEKCEGQNAIMNALKEKGIVPEFTNVNKIFC